MAHHVTERERRYTLFMLVVVFTSSHVDRQIMGILGQPIKESLLISDTQLGLLTGIMFAAFYATLGMPMAMWADRHNRRNLISFSVFPLVRGLSIIVPFVSLGVVSFTIFE